MRNKMMFGRCKMPMNLQFFAEGGEPDAGGAIGGGAGGSAGTDGDGSTGTEPGAAGAEGTPGVGFDDFLKDPKNQAEFDRRVNKALETSRAKMQADIETKINAARTEAEKLAKMNAEQKAQYEAEKRENELKTREAEITKRELSAAAKETLADKGLPLELATILNYESAETCQASIEAVEKSFREAVQKAVEDKLRGGNPPKKAPQGTQTVFTAEQIKAMSPDEVNRNWDAIQASMKNGL